MAVTTVLDSGFHTLVQNEVYALPCRPIQLFSDLAVEVSNTTDFAAKQTTVAATSITIAGAFLRCTTGAAKVAIATY